jgi:ATP-dependent Lon protease
LCTDNYLDFFKEMEEVPTTEEVVGQERAMEALDLGLKLKHPGYNVYVAGMAGTGRLSTIKRALRQMEGEHKPAPDRCYVYNFVDSSRPVLLTFAYGQGKVFRDDMAELIRVLRAEVPKALESSHVVREREMLVERYQRKEKALFEEFAESLKKEGFALIQVQEGTYVAPTVFPVVGDEAVSVDYLDTLVKDGKIKPEERDAKKIKHKELVKELQRVLQQARGLGKEMHQALDRLLQRTGSLVLDGLMDDLRKRYKDEKVRKYLMRVKSHILKNLESFTGKDRKAGDQQEAVIVLGGKQPENPFWVYEVNLLYDPSSEGGNVEEVPVLEEDNPSYVNMFGAIEYNVAPGGVWNTDFRHIKAGSLLRADGGYLVVNALDVLRRPMVWDQLKRVLKTEKLTIQQPESYFQIAPLMVKPEPIELNVKVIMIGSKWLYQMLFMYEEDFPKIFKILSDFDTSMPRNKETEKEFTSVLKTVAERGDMLPLGRDGVAAMLEHGVEEAGQQDRLSTRFSYITDVLREANWIARKSDEKSITRKSVENALEKKKKRHKLYEDRIQRAIEEDVLMIDTAGKKVGQINGLSVYTLGDFSFGKPSRVTAVTSLGKAGLINIERESRLSGPIHDKGVFVISGYLRSKYGQSMPLNLSASICFEQSYGGVDGDSASSTELYAIISSLTDLPIRQDIAVTGSVNQLGDIQPIGGVNEKIAGFYDVCKSRGLTGTQGVMIPKQNERHLMLRKDVAQAVAKGKFHVYSIGSIDEGIELLTGVEAGEMRKDGKYPPKSVHGQVVKKLKKMTEALKEFDGATGEEVKKLPAREKARTKKKKVKPKKKKTAARAKPKKRAKKRKKR